MEMARPKPRPELVRQLAFVAVLVLVGSFALSVTHLQGPICYFRLLFHIPCPGCGLTRSLESVWHGDLASSFRFHPLGLPIFVLSIAAILRAAGGRTRPQRAPRFALGWLSVRNVFLVFGVVWTVRLGFVIAGSRFFLW